MTVWAQGFQNDVREATAGGTAQSASYTFTNLPPGIYRISATWTPYSNRANDAPYVINGGLAIPINQKLSPGHSSFTSVVDSGATFADLDSSYSLPSGGTITVGLSDSNANGNVIIDAIRLELTGALHVDVGSDVDSASAPKIATPDVQALLAVATGYWTTVDAAGSERLTEVQVIVKDLPPSVLGLGSFTTSTIWLDDDAAGLGWRIDAVTGTGQIDLLTVIAHELGHVLGLPDLDPHEYTDSIMAATLPRGRGFNPMDAGLLAPSFGLTPRSYRNDSPIPARNAEQVFSRFDSRDSFSDLMEPDQAPLQMAARNGASNAKRLANSTATSNPSADDRVFRRRHFRIDREDALDKLFAALGDDRQDSNLTGDDR